MQLRVRAGCLLNEGNRSYKEGVVFEIDDARGKRILEADPPAVEKYVEPPVAPLDKAAAKAAEKEAKAAAKAAESQ
mgnify:CR=1 FL=1